MGRPAGAAARVVEPGPGLAQTVGLGPVFFALYLPGRRRGILPEDRLDPLPGAILGFPDGLERPGITRLPGRASVPRGALSLPRETKPVRLMFRVGFLHRVAVLAPDQLATWRIIASSLVKSMGLVMCVVNPASRLRRMSSSMP